MTRWGKAIDPEHVLEEYPRPGMKRDSYVCLNGFWDYAITDSRNFPENYDGEILVPFSPEAPLSGVNRMLMPGMYLHYKKSFSVEKMKEGSRLLLHFGAVDQSCEVYVNGCLAGDHTGGYLHFSFDISSLVHEGENVLQLVVQDLTDTSYQARGKQSMERGGMWYTPQSGIWQSVWMEYVPGRYIEKLILTPDVDSSNLNFTVVMNKGEPLPVKVRVSLQEEIIFRAEGMMSGVNCKVQLPSCVLWSPENPVLYDLTVTAGEDEVESYFAMRKISVEKDSKGILRMFLNNRPYFQNGVLDQGYYPDGLYTAPSDEAMINDILLMKELGFNMLRKHVKIEPDRWYYHCDRLGMVVWQDMVNGGERFRGAIKNAILKRIPTSGSRVENLRPFLRESAAGRDEFIREVRQTICQLYNYPSIVLWVPFNEGWGQFETNKVTAIIQEMDPSRLVDEASGWFDQGGGDISSIHNYFVPLVVKPQQTRCVALSEFGGYSWHIPGHCFTEDEFGYRKYRSMEELTREIERLWRRELFGNIRNGLSATVFTEVSDVEDETNGLLTYDREIIKVDADKIIQINSELLEIFEKEI